MNTVHFDPKPKN